MDALFQLPDEYSSLRKSVRALAEEKIAPFARDVDENARFPEEAALALSANNLSSAHVPEEFGGTGFPQFLVKLSTGEIIEIEVSKDPEGNDGGFLFGLPDFTLPEFREGLTKNK